MRSGDHEARCVRLPLGSVLPSLPVGCKQQTVGNVANYTGGRNWYRAVFRGNTLVWVTVAKPE